MKRKSSRRKSMKGSGWLWSKKKFLDETKGDETKDKTIEIEYSDYKATYGSEKDPKEDPKKENKILVPTKTNKK